MVTINKLYNENNRLNFDPYYFPTNPTIMFWTNINKINLNTYKIVHHWETCKDYILDYFYRGHRNRYCPETTAKGQDHYIAVIVHDSKDLALIKRKIKSTMNPYERKHGFLSRTEVYTNVTVDNNNKISKQIFIIKIPKEWFRTTLTIVSIYLSKLRMIIQGNTGDITKLKEFTCNEYLYFKRFKMVAEAKPDYKTLTKNEEIIFKDRIELYNRYIKATVNLHKNPLILESFFNPKKHAYFGVENKNLKLHGISGIFYHMQILLDKSSITDCYLNELKAKEVNKKMSAIQSKLNRS